MAGAPKGAECPVRSLVWSGVLLTLALSADGFVVGLHYGLRRIHLPWTSWAIVGACSAAGMAASMLFGGALAGRFSPETAKSFGGALLVLLGLWQLLQGFSEYIHSGSHPGSGAAPDPSGATSDPAGAISDLERATSDPASAAQGPLREAGGARPLLNLRLRSLGIAVQILADPVRADADRSGTIDVREAVLLGAALGADTLAAGAGAAMLGFGPAMVLAVTFGLLALLALGISAGRRWEGFGPGRKKVFLPGVILLAAGLLQL